MQLEKRHEIERKSVKLSSLHASEESREREIEKSKRERKRRVGQNEGGK